MKNVELSAMSSPDGLLCFCVLLGVGHFSVVFKLPKSVNDKNEYLFDRLKFIS